MSEQDWDDAPSVDLNAVEGLDLPIPGKPKTHPPVPGARAHAPSASKVPSRDWEWGDADYSDTFDEVGERQVEAVADDQDLLDSGYRELANNPEEQQIAAERQMNRAARSGIPPVPPAAPSPTSASPVPGVPGVQGVPVPGVPSPVPVTPTVSQQTVPGVPLPQESTIPASQSGKLPAGAPVDLPSLGGDDWEDAPVAGVALPLAEEDVVEIDNEVPWLGRQVAGAALPSITLSQAGILPEYIGEVPVAGDPNDIDFDPDEEPLSGEDRKPLQKSPVKKKSHKKVRLTERDMEILAFLARYRIANVNMLAQRFETSVSALRNRLPALEREGLITSSWVTQSKPKVWLITSSGLNTVGMSLTAPTIRWGQLRHTLGLTEMGIKFEMAGEKVLTEREIRAAATRYTPTKRLRTAIDFAATVQALEETPDSIVEKVRTALTVPVPNRGFGHIPDMVLVREPYPNGASGSIAIELELTRKGLSEWKTVLTAYRDSGNFDQVYYLVVASEIKRGLEGVIKAIGAQDKIHVMPIVLQDLTGDPEANGGGGE